MFEARPGTRVPLTISVGAAVFPHDGDGYEALLAAADSRMYRDKSVRRRKDRKHRRRGLFGGHGGTPRRKPDNVDGRASAGGSA